MMIHDCTAVILAGGESKRMGQDKASILFAGDTLLNRAVKHLQPLFEHIIISVREYNEALTLPQICDKDEGRGPIMGIASALKKVDTHWVFVMAVDMPFVSVDLIGNLAEKRGNKQAVVPMVDEHVQPLLAYYAKGCLPVMQQQIADGQRSLRQLIKRVDSLIVEQDELEKFDPNFMSFLDLDSQKDVKYAENIMKKRQMI